MPTSNPFTLPPEYQAPIDLASMRAQLAQAMMQRYAKPAQGQMVGKHYVKSNPLQHLANALGTHWQQQGMESAVKEAGTLKAKAGADLQAERQSIIEALSPTPGPVLSTGVGEALPGPDVPGDPRKAEQLALAAKFPGNRDLAKVLMDQRMKLFEAGAKGATNLSTVAAAQAGGDVNQLEGAYSGGVTERTIAGKPAALTRDPKDGSVKVQFAPRDFSVSATASTGGKVEETGVKHSLSQVEKSTTGAEGAVKSLRSIQEALGALDQGAKTGITQPFQQVVRKLFEDFGIKAGAEANDTLTSRLKQQVIDKAGGLGRAISDKDVQFMSEAGGSLATNPMALRRILAINAAMDMMAIEKHNQRITAMMKAYPQLEASLQGDLLPIRFRPGEKTDPMIQAVMEGKSTFDAVPAPPTSGPEDLGKAVVPGSGGRPLTPAEQKELEELRAWQAKRGSK